MNEFFQQLQECAPLIRVDASNISILESPIQFYNTIIDKISTSRKRIILSTLYIGSDILSRKMVST